MLIVKVLNCMHDQTMYTIRAFICWYIILADGSHITWSSDPNEQIRIWKSGTLITKGNVKDLYHI